MAPPQTATTQLAPKERIQSIKEKNQKDHVLLKPKENEKKENPEVDVSKLSNTNTASHPDLKMAFHHEQLEKLQNSKPNMASNF